ncbi:MAG: LptF/LptG family permease [Chitinophagaceae bacterium]
MIKKLDILIIRSFLGPFFATFLISLFVLDMQFLWLYIDDLVGKGLDVLTLLRLIGVVSITWVPMALPLALLLSSIMTFGNLGETFEIVAIKSAGIPLLRFMQPLLIITCLLSVTAFFFANNIIPYAQLKLARLKYDIIVAKPAFDIKEGVFYNKIDGYVIKLGKKDKDDSTIHNIVIYERNNYLQDNMLIAEHGIMRVTPNKQFLEFVLKNGWRYQEKGPRYTDQTEFIRLGFKEYKKVFDLSSFKINKTDDSSFRYDPKMLSIRQLNVTIDSITSLDTVFYNRAKNDIVPFLPFAKAKDSNFKKVDTVLPKSTRKGLAAYIPDSLATNFADQVVNSMYSLKTNATMLSTDYLKQKETMRYHEIEWHRKFTLSVACLVLFLIGAPLGSIIRKGGLGTPLVFAIVFFVFFHLLNTFGEKLSREGVTTPLEGMWLSPLLLLPVGAFLTFKAMRDSQLFNNEAYFRLFKKLQQLFRKLLFLFKRSPKNNEPQVEL